jgi:hypothetical protein
MSHVRTFGRFCYEFVVGDDWTVAVAMVIAVVATALVAHHDLAAWWLMPLAVAATLTWTVLRATRATRP